MRVGLLSVGIAIALPVGGVLAAAAQVTVPPDEEAGLCPQLGCRSGPVKCADGTLTTPSGSVVPYVCYTTIGET